MVVGSDRPDAHERIDRSCDLLASAHRRHVVYALRTDGPATVDELADAVVDAGLTDARERVLVSLVHTHLPKLADYDVVDYNGTDEVVSLADGVERLEPFLTATARQETDADLPSRGENGSSDSVTETGRN